MGQIQQPASQETSSGNKRLTSFYDEKYCVANGPGPRHPLRAGLPRDRS